MKDEPNIAYINCYSVGDEEYCHAFSTKEIAETYMNGIIKRCAPFKYANMKIYARAYKVDFRLPEVN